MRNLAPAFALSLAISGVVALGSVAQSGTPATRVERLTTASLLTHRKLNAMEERGKVIDEKVSKLIGVVARLTARVKELETAGVEVERRLSGVQKQVTVLHAKKADNK